MDPSVLCEIWSISLKFFGVLVGLNRLLLMVAVESFRWSLVEDSSLLIFMVDLASSWSGAVNKWCCRASRQQVVHQQQPFFVVKACTASFIHLLTARSISTSLDLTDLQAWRASGAVAVLVTFRRRFGVFWRPNRRGHDSAAATPTKMLLLPYPLLLYFIVLALSLQLFNLGVGSGDCVFVYPGVQSGGIAVGSTMSLGDIVLLQIQSDLQLHVLSTYCFYLYCMLIFFVSSIYDVGRCSEVISTFCVVYTLCVLNPEFYLESDSWISFNAILYGKRIPIGKIDDTFSGDFPNWIFKKISRSVLAFKCPGVCRLRSLVWGNIPFGPGLHTSSFCVTVVYFSVDVSSL